MMAMVDGEEDFSYKIRNSNALYERWAICQSCTTFLSLIDLCGHILTYNMREKYDFTDRQNLIRYWFTVLCNILVVFSVYIRWDLWFKWSIQIQKFSRYDTLANTGHVKWIVAEMIILLIGPTFVLDGVTYTEYNSDLNFDTVYHVNDFLLFFSFIRLYLLARCILIQTIYMNPRAQRVCA